MSRVRAPLVGRAAELGALEAALAEVRAGASRTFVVAGEAGIGKSRLVDELTLSVRDDGATLVVRGTCAGSSSGPIPYAALEGVLRDVVGALGVDETLAAAGPGADALGLIAPRLIDVRPDVMPGRLPEVVAGLLVEVARSRPLVVVVEDLHWSDDTTRATVDRLARVAGDTSMLLVVTYRSDDVGRGHPLRGVIAELERSRVVTRIDLRRLDRAEVAQLASALLDTDELGPGLADLIERSDGVPFYVEELLGSLGSSLPESLRDLLLLRYRRLSPTAQEFCRWVAAAGLRAPYDLLADALGADTLTDTEAAAREAVEAAVLVGDGDAYAFRHALVQEAVYTELLPGERRRLHSDYAAALATLPSTVSRLSEIADHWWKARVLDRALATAVTAFGAADAAGSRTTAASLGERALELWEMVPDASDVAGLSHHGLLIRVADAVAATTRLDRAVALSRQALDEWPEDDRYGLALALDDAAVIMAQSGSEEGRVLLERGLALVPPGTRDDVRVALLVSKARDAMLDGRASESVAYATECYDTAIAVGAMPQASLALNMRGVSRVVDKGDEGGFDDLELARQLAGDVWMPLGRYFTNTSHAYLVRGQYARAFALAEEGARRSHALGAGWSSAAMLEGNMAECMIALGQWDRAQAWYEQSVPLVSSSAFAVYLRERWAWLLMWRGDVDAAETLVRSSEAEWARVGRLEAQVRTRVAETMAHLALLRDDPELALQLITDVVLAPDRPRDSAYDPSMLAVAARAVAMLRRSPGAEGPDISPYRALLAKCTHTSRFELWAAVFAAELGEAPWSVVVDLDGGPAHVRPYALLRDGEALLADGDRAAARDRLAEAVEAARAIGCGLVADQAEATLSSVGLRAPRRGDGDELTDRERQVLELVADGLTNGQIAERLFISPKTASVHVSAILRKLGVASRTEAAVKARSVSGA
ncbi:helix-turn-helix transcriptional regulator [Mumia sp. Pv 4-285]|uniref:helix-turn-helix transcriptional regulator n=1 Tax=Mumia qirimensis TaxID=3234852 RepID=UPI00351D1542